MLRVILYEFIYKNHHTIRRYDPIFDEFVDGYVFNNIFFARQVAYSVEVLSYVSNVHKTWNRSFLYFKLNIRGQIKFVYKVILNNSFYAKQ